MVAWLTSWGVVDVCGQALLSVCGHGSAMVVMKSKGVSSSLPRTSSEKLDAHVLVDNMHGFYYTSVVVGTSIGGCRVVIECAAAAALSVSANLSRRQINLLLNCFKLGEALLACSDSVVRHHTVAATLCLPCCTVAD